MVQFHVGAFGYFLVVALDWSPNADHLQCLEGRTIGLNLIASKSGIRTLHLLPDADWACMRRCLPNERPFIKQECWNKVDGA